MKQVLLVPLLLWMIGCAEPPKPQPAKPETVSSVAPTLVSVVPATVVEGSKFYVQSDGSSALAVTGTGYERGSAIAVNGKKLPTVFGNPGWITATMAAGLYEKPGVLKITVINPDGKESNAGEFTITPKAAKK